MKTKTIKEIEVYLKEHGLSEAVQKELNQDKRSGVKRLLKQYEEKQAKAIKEIELNHKLRHFDLSYRKNKTDLIAGVDEAGRGPLAGPVVAAACILPDDLDLKGLTDSKDLTKEQRELFYSLIIENALSYAVEVVDSDVIDQINILEATKKAMSQSINHLHIKPTLTLIDAVKLTDTACLPIIKGDQKSLTIAAASVLAKVTRDRIMLKYHKLYPEYGFNRHQGYATKEHLLAIEKYGVLPIHRKTFAPIKHF